MCARTLIGNDTTVFEVGLKINVSVYDYILLSNIINSTVAVLKILGKGAKGKTLWDSRIFQLYNISNLYV